jgi:hypothetical protein
MPALQIANIVLPTPEEDAQRQAIHDKLDEIARKLREPKERAQLEDFYRHKA